MMRRRTSTAFAVLCGGGPADGERRPVEEGAEAIVVPEPAGDEPLTLADAVRGHLYERREDGRYAYCGTIEQLPQLPAAIHPDSQALGLAALGHDKGPSALAISAMIVVVAVVMFCFGTFT